MAAARGPATHAARPAGRGQPSASADGDVAGLDDAPVVSSTDGSQSDARSAAMTDASSAASPTVQTGQATYHAVADVKTVTDVKTPSAPDPTPSDGTARIREAMASVANQSVIRGATSGTVDIPELGRVVVNARTEGGALDMSVTAAHSTTQQVLQSHASAIVADLRHAALPVSRLTIDLPTTSSGTYGSSTSHGERQASSGDGSRQQSPTPPPDTDEPAATPTKTARVRIVL
ncbi:MAG: hypothetical protein ABTD50_15195 [Polyangiaceae bacterium]